MGELWEEPQLGLVALFLCVQLPTVPTAELFLVLNCQD